MQTSDSSRRATEGIVDALARHARPADRGHRVPGHRPPRTPPVGLPRDPARAARPGTGRARPAEARLRETLGGERVRPAPRTGRRRRASGPGRGADRPDRGRHPRRPAGPSGRPRRRRPLRGHRVVRLPDRPRVPDERVRRGAVLRADRRRREPAPPGARVRPRTSRDPPRASSRRPRCGTTSTGAREMAAAFAARDEVEDASRRPGDARRLHRPRRAGAPAGRPQRGGGGRRGAPPHVDGSSPGPVRPGPGPVDGVARRLHVHQGARRTRGGGAGRGARPAAVDRAPLDHRERAGAAVSRVDRGIQDGRANHPGLRPRVDPGVPRHPRRGHGHHPGRPGHQRDAGDRPPTPPPATPQYFHVCSGSRNPLSFRNLYRLGSRVLPGPSAPGTGPRRAPGARVATSPGAGPWRRSSGPANG